MATEQEITRTLRFSRDSRASSSVGYYSDEDNTEEEEEDEEDMEEIEEDEEDEDEEEDEEEEDPRVGLTCGGGRRNGSSNNNNKWMMLGRILDPRSKWVQEWNRVFLLVCATGLFVDPLFLYTISVNDTCMCLLVDGWLALTVTALRSMTDLLHLWNIWVQFKIARRWPYPGGDSDGDNNKGGGTRGSMRVVPQYVKKRGFFFDLFVILPLPQVVLWVVIPSLLKRGSVTLVVSVLLVTFIFQYLPKIYHSIRHLRRNANFSGYIFGTVWWGIALNMIAYFVAAHAAGACWYLLGVQRSAKCLKEQCENTIGCDIRMLSCKEPVYYGTTVMVLDKARLAWAKNHQARSVCLDINTNYTYGAYQWTIQLVSNESRLEKILFPIFWGLMTLSTFGNLESTTEWSEVVFNIIVLTSGLLLVTMLIGNIKVFLHATTSKKQAMHLKMRNVEWWMKKRHLPLGFRQRVRNYERQRWAAMRGVDECEMVQNLPEGLRRDIKYHLCLDLVRQVPLFQHMDDLVLENICDRVKSLIFTKGETIQKEGDAVQRMLFVVRGHLQSSQFLRDGVKSCCMLGPGNFSGDELLSWCLRRPFVERLPPSSSTLVTLETTEAFGLDAEDVKYVTQHFRYTFVNEKVKRSARYYSPGWRTWAAVAVQLAWRRYKHRLTLTSLSFIRPRRPLSRCASLGEDKLRLYTAMLTSPKPNPDDFDDY
ncbi:cyclic nucleotide-gated ion channel 4 [Capsella rubella]|uniref:cyclic nucleotide-gated ion channel 4 n=1 Tax=Capsella rubella TaxID=81985 RepID=UPI000CD52DD7|nr:cyclic nucleotide-gated ion channel 4 [Capsella rubella]